MQLFVRVSRSVDRGAACRSCQAGHWPKHKPTCRSVNNVGKNTETTRPARDVPSHKRQHALCSALTALAPIAEAPDAWLLVQQARSPILMHLLVALQAAGLSQPLSATPWDDIAAAYLPDPGKSEDSEDGSSGNEGLETARQGAAAAARVGAAVTLVMRVELAKRSRSASGGQGRAEAEGGFILGAEASEEVSTREALASKGSKGLAAEACRVASPLRMAAQAAGKAHGVRNAAELVTMILAGSTGSGRGSERDEPSEGSQKELGASQIEGSKGACRNVLQGDEGGASYTMHGDVAGRGRQDEVAVGKPSSVDESVQCEAEAALRAMAFGASEDVRFSCRRFLVVRCPVNHCVCDIGFNVTKQDQPSGPNVRLHSARAQQKSPMPQ